MTSETPDVDRRSDTERRQRELRRVQDELLLDELREQREDLRRGAFRKELQNWILIALVLLAALAGDWEHAAQVIQAAIPLGAGE